MERENDYPHQGYKGDIGFDVEAYKHSPFLLEGFFMKAFVHNWTRTEIQDVRDFLTGKSFDEQIAILKFYCFIPRED